MTISRRTVAALLFGATLSGWIAPAEAGDRTIFAGCVTDRRDTSITLNTSGGESIVVDTRWITPTMLDALTADCLTVTTLTVEGRYVAESVEAGDEPNEVHSFANESTADREHRARRAEEHQDKDDDDD